VLRLPEAVPGDRQYRVRGEPYPAKRHLTQHHGKAVRPLNSVSAVTAWRFDCNQLVEIQVDNGLKSFRGRGFA
jgi:hypothetical protein